jgi:toxin-antitoxin system PIN domain toxin
VIAVDTNILVYAHRPDSKWHDAAAAHVRKLAERREAWAIPWPCVHEFLAIVTHPRIFSPPTPLDRALDQVLAWLESPSLTVLSETGNHFATLAELAQLGQVVGPRVHDARIAAICLTHGVTELWSADRNFSRFPRLQVRNPLS